MSYIVVKNGRDNIKLFLVNRNVTKKKWWTIHLHDAIQFRKESAAEHSASHLRFGDCFVATYEEAQKLEKDNMHELAMLDEHPFSSEALGQN